LGGELGDDYAVARLSSTSVIRLPGNRFEIFVPPDAAPGAWQTLARRCVMVGAGRWEWLDIHAGLPTVMARTQEQFVPQMANLELIGGVSFKKGCYTGQEIVARSQYLGKVKRRMFLAHIASDLAPQPGDKLFGQGPEEQSGGMIVNAQPAPDGGYDTLAVVLSTSVEAGDVHWNTPDGPVLTFASLPYAID
jgi:tRNA-modifying protein YgfZ